MPEPKIKENRWKKEFELELFTNWQKSGIYKFNMASKNIFSIDTPPPTANSKWHIAGASAYAQIDMIARTARMQGFDVIFPWCSDRNGLPMEVSVEKQFKVHMREVGREKFIEMCSNWATQIHSQITEIAQRLGFSCDYGGDFYYETDKPYYRKMTQATFIELWHKGMVYVDDKPNNYCSVCGTTIADAEIEYQDLPTELNYLKFKIKEKNEYLEVATTRPELLGACAIVLYNPNDDRYKKYKNATLIVPILNTEVKLIEHPYAKPEFGTGLVMICSYGDYGDVRLFRELKLKPINMIGQDGRINQGHYKGLKVIEARKKIIDDIKKEGLFIRAETITHRTPLCWRSKTPIEFVAMPEYYLKQVEFVPEMLKIAKGLKFHPEEHKQILLDWVNSVSQDWVISRRRFYGTEIPIWYCKKCKEPWLPKPGEYYQPWKNPPPDYAKCKCGGKEFIGEERTFDTWMDSGISELFVTGYMRYPELFKRAFPCTIRPQGKDIIRSWLYYTLLRAYQLFKMPAFVHAFVHGHGVDEQGRKMSKSLGNVVDPIPAIEKHGADAIRFWVAAETSLGNDWRYSEDRMESSKKFMTKLWNISRFISSFPMKETKNLELADKWIISELNETIRKCMAGYDDFNFFVPANAIKNFAWNFFADNYLELVKNRAYKEDAAACYTLHTCLNAVLKLLAPICPFVTEKIWLELYSKKSIHQEKFPMLLGYQIENSKTISSKLLSSNSVIWKYKKDKGLSLNSPLKKVWLPKELEPMKEDLKNMHNITELVFGAPKEGGKLFKEEEVSIAEE